MIPHPAQIPLLSRCAILLFLALVTPSWAKDLDTFPNLNLSDPGSVKEAARVLEDELKLAARPQTYVLIDLVEHTIHIKGRGVELHQMPIERWSAGERKALAGIHRLVSRPPVVRRKIEPGAAAEQEPISLSDMPLDYTLSFTSGLAINVVPMASKGNLLQGLAFMGKGWWRRFANWSNTIWSDQSSPSAAHLELTISVDHAQSLAWSLVNGMAVVIRRAADS
ncbi:MAG: hypothetical protein AB7P24_06985 [Nitrospira sp.]